MILSTLAIVVIFICGCVSLSKAPSPQPAFFYDYDNGQVKEKNPIVNEIPSYWGQQIIGADLARRYMATLKIEKAKMAIIDSGFGDPESIKTKSEPHAFHGRATTSLVKHPAYGVAAFAEIKLQHIFGPEREYQKFLRKVRQERVDLLLMEMAAEPSTPPDSELTKTTKAILTIIPAGNEENAVVAPADRRTKAILVGCMTYEGSVCKFSRSAKFENGLSGVLVLAPGEPGTIADFIEPGMPFGATSGAAALAAGAIANVISILGPLTPDQAHEMMKRTAIPLVAVPKDENTGHGYGLLNAYKLVRVAARVQANFMKEFGSMTGASPQQRQKFLSAELQNPQNYDFVEEASRTLEAAKKTLETAWASAYDLGRIAFFLDPSQKRKEFAEFKNILNPALD